MLRATGCHIRADVPDSHVTNRMTSFKHPSLLAGSHAVCILLPLVPGRILPGAAIEGCPLQSLLNPSGIRMPDAANKSKTATPASRAVEAYVQPNRIGLEKLPDELPVMCRPRCQYTQSSLL